MDIPHALSDTHERWIQAGSPPQLPMSWNLGSWNSRFDEHKDFLDQLHGKRLDRATVAELGASVDTETQAIELFIASMIWGFGSAGYGPFRTRRILDTPNAPQNLLELARIAREEGGVAAFDHFARMRESNREYLKYLGPAFGTKFIYFAQKAANPTNATPVMDAVIRKWFAAYAADTRLFLNVWHPPSYKTYVEHLADWAKILEPGSPIPMDQVEYLIFAGPHRNWAAPDDVEPELSVTELIDRLKAHAETNGTINDEVTKLLDDVDRLFNPEADFSSVS